MSNTHLVRSVCCGMLRPVTSREYAKVLVLPRSRKWKIRTRIAPAGRFDKRGFGPSAAGCECTPGPSPSGRSRIAVNACSHCLAWHTIGRHVPPTLELVSLRCFPCRSSATPLFGGPNDATLLFEFGNRTRAPSLLPSTCQRSHRQDRGIGVGTFFNWIDALAASIDVFVLPVIAAVLLRQQLLARDRGDHAPAAALVWHAGSLFQFGNLVLKLSLLLFQFTGHAMAERR